MSRLFTSGSSEYLEQSSDISGSPLTMAAWVYHDNTTTQAVVSLANSGATGDYFELQCSNAHRAIANTVAGGSSASASSGTGTINTWLHLCAVFASATSRAAYINGGGKGTNTTSRTPSAQSTIGIGRVSASTPLRYFGGRIAEVGIWNVALTDDEVLALAGGVSPLLIRPTSLYLYVPITGRDNPENSPWQNMTLAASKTSFSATGTSFADHPPVRYPASNLLRYKSSAASNVSGTSAQVLPRLTQAAAASQTNHGAAAQTLPVLTQSAAGTVDNRRSATAAQTLPKLAQAATATQTNHGAIAQTLPILSQSAAGTVDNDRTATIAQTLPVLTQSATGTVDNDRTASIAQTLAALTQAATGTVSSTSITATIAQTLPAATGAATAAQENSAAITQALPSLRQAAVGTTGATVTDTYGGFNVVYRERGYPKKKKRKVIKQRVFKQIGLDITDLAKEADQNFRIDQYLAKVVQDAALEEQIQLSAEALARLADEIKREEAAQFRALQAYLAEQARLAVEAAIAEAERQKQRRYRQDEHDVLTALMMGII